MIFRKFNFWKTFFFLALFLGILNMSAYALAESDALKPNDKCSQQSSGKISRGRIFGNKILCTETFECFPETEILSNNIKEKFYKKTLEVTKEFSARKKDGSFKKLSQCKFQVVFTYDKKTFVKVENCEKDIDISINNDKWSIMDVKEIFPDDKVCLVSLKCVLYKEDLLGVHEYMMDGHVDVMCSIMGNIGINTDLH